MYRDILRVFVALIGLIMPPRAHAVICVNGITHTGCVASHGDAKLPEPPRPPVAHAAPSGATTCVNGVSHVGCKGPNGAVTPQKVD